MLKLEVCCSTLLDSQEVTKIARGVCNSVFTIGKVVDCDFEDNSVVAVPLLGSLAHYVALGKIEKISLKKVNYLGLKI